MSRLTKCEGDLAVIDELCEHTSYSNIQAVIEKLAHYEDLEEQLEKIYGGKLPLEKVVENLNRIVQNGEEKLDFARILTNEEAARWVIRLGLSARNVFLVYMKNSAETLHCAMIVRLTEK